MTGPAGAQGDSPGRAHWWLLASGAIPLLGLAARPPQTTLLIYTLFTAVLAARGTVGRASGRCRLPPWACFTLVLWATGLGAEVLAWANEHLAGKAAPALFHPELVPDLILVSGLFFGWAAAWGVAFTRYRYSLWEVFAITGLLGVFIEQNGAVITSVVALLPVNPVQSAVMAIFVFAVYGSIPGIAYVAVSARIALAERRSWVQVPVAIALLFVGGKAGAFLVRVIADGLALIPPPRPI